MNSVIVYECMPSTLTTWVPALPPDGEWVRVIPCALPDECVVSSRRTEDPGTSFVDLETEYDLKSFGPGDVWFRGPAIIVSNAMVTALEAFSMGGFTTLPLEHATPFAPSIPAPVRLVPTHSLPTVGAGVALHPASHPRGRSYGYHGRPSEPLTLRGPTLDPRHVYGSPWFATSSLPFQCLILSAWFVERFRELRDTAFQDPDSYFHRYADLTDRQADTRALEIWSAINERNLLDNILPTRERATLIARKGPDHEVVEVQLRRV